MMDGRDEPGPGAPKPPLFDAYAPAEMARRVETVGVAKAGMTLLPLISLAVLAGAFIALGAMFYSVVMTGSTLGVGPSRLLGGLAFSLGLVLVVVGGAELFTGNSLIVMAWADRKVTTAALLRNWGLVYLGNLVGGVGMAVMAFYSGFLHIGGDAVGTGAVATAAAKVALPWGEAFLRGVLCNVLVCLAVWLTYAAHDVASKILAVVFPITAFVALGFEHSIANMYFIPLGILASQDSLFSAAGTGVNLTGFLRNLIPVTVGNVVGGGVFVALAYWAIYLRGSTGKQA